MMKKSYLLLLFSMYFICSGLQAQVPLDSVRLRPLKGAAVPFSTVTAKDDLVMICLWSVNSDNSMAELNAINTQYEKWRQSAPFHLLAITIDAGNLQNRMRPTANMNGWTFDVFGDLNGDLEEIMHVNPNQLPTTMILRKGKILFQQNGYTSGSESYLFDKIRELSARK